MPKTFYGRISLNYFVTIADKSRKNSFCFTLNDFLPFLIKIILANSVICLWQSLLLQTALHPTGRSRNLSRMFEPHFYPRAVNQIVFANGR